MGLRLNGIFKDNMIIQRDKVIRVFGDVDSKSEIKASLLDNSGKMISGGIAEPVSGHFLVNMTPVEAGGPYKLLVKAGSSSVTIGGIYAGEVWIAGGQSNMEMPLIRTTDSKDVIDACKEGRVHYYCVPVADVVNEDTIKAEDESEWVKVSSKTCANMSGLAYYFSEILEKELDVHIGIIECFLGGTSVSSWQSKEALESTPEGRRYLKEFDKSANELTPTQYDMQKIQFDIADKKYWDEVNERLRENPYMTYSDIHERFGDGPWPPPCSKDSIRRPSALYEAMVSRITPFSSRGVIFYQGENDCETRAGDYDVVFSTLILNWRQAFMDDELPFIFAQLPMYISKDRKYMDFDDLTWPILRSRQYRVSRQVPGAYMAVLIDQGEFDNIHPSEKRIPAERFANLALRNVYLKSEFLSEYPRCIDVRRGSEGLELTFRGDFSMLLLKGAFSDDYGFEMAGDDGEFHTASASVDFDGKTLILSCPNIELPMQVRYAYFSYGNAGLRGDTGLPAIPFFLKVDTPLGNNPN